MTLDPRRELASGAPPSPAVQVYLVGAGPGDPALLTLRGAECLSRADVVMYDYLVNPQILQHAPVAAERICLGQHGRSRIWSQDEINAELVQRAHRGKTVVRLKGGDPAIFGRLAEEAAELAREGVRYEIVPGVTAGLAAASYAGIPLTHRLSSSAVALVTGQEDADKDQSALDYPALARFPGTLVFYMGVTTAPDWTNALLCAGKSADTPVAVVRRCSLPDQQILVCTLGTLVERLAGPPRMRPPAIVIVGDVAREAGQASWFVRRPLFRTRILVTRAEGQADELRRPLEELGAEVLVQPVIRIEAPASWQEVDHTIGRLREFQWLVFSSANGVRAFCGRLEALGRDGRAFAAARIAAIGPGTADELRRFHLHTDLVPPEFRAESLAQSLAPDAPGKRFLLVRASRGREVLAETLRSAGGLVEQIVVYRSTDVTVAAQDVALDLAGGRIDWVTVTSSAIARALVGMFGETLRNTRLASISPITSTTLRECGFEPAAEAAAYTMSGLIAAMQAAQR